MPIEGRWGRSSRVPRAIDVVLHVRIRRPHCLDGRDAARPCSRASVGSHRANTPVGSLTGAR